MRNKGEWAVMGGKDKKVSCKLAVRFNYSNAKLEGAFKRIYPFRFTNSSGLMAVNSP